MTDTMLSSLALRCVEAAVRAALPLVGTGASSSRDLDELATVAIKKELLPFVEPLGLFVASAEGTRDGALELTLPPPSAPRTAIYCDPVDGSLAASQGGSRSVSIIALTQELRPAWHRYLPDSTALFSVGAHSPGAEDLFAEPERIRSRLTDLITTTRVGTLNRPDNLRLLTDLDTAVATSASSTEMGGYANTLTSDRLLAVGDVTVTLSVECDSEVGRMGLVEGAIQAGLYSSWSGMIVSSRKLHDPLTDPVSYLTSLRRAVIERNSESVEAHFTEQETRSLEATGASLLEICAPLTPANFGIGRTATVAIAGLSGVAGVIEPASRLIASSDIPTLLRQDGVWRTPTSQADQGR